MMSPSPPPHFNIVLVIIAALLAVVGCSSNGSSKGDPDASTDTDTDTDSDTDTDTESDTYTDEYFGNGTLEWALGIGGLGPDATPDLAVLDDGSVLVPCNQRSDTVFGIGQDPQFLVEERGLSLARVAPDGEIMWAKSMCAADWVAAAGIAVSDGGHICMAGALADPAVLGAGESNEVELTSAGEADGFLASFDMDGGFEWVRQIHGAQEDIGWDVAVAGNGDIVFLGSYHGEATLDDGMGGQETLSGEVGERRLLLARYSEAGELLWTRTGGPLGNYGEHDIFEMLRLSMTADDSIFVTFGRGDGDVVLAEGEADETVVPFPTDGMRGVLVRFGSDGTVQWGRALSGFNARFGLAPAAMSDGSAVFVVSEASGESVVGEGDPNQVALSCSANYDCGVLARYDGTGAVEWAMGFQSDAWTNLLDVRVGPDDSVVVAGAFGGVMGVPTRDGSPYELEARGIFEILTAKYDLDGVLQWAEQAGSTSDMWNENGWVVATDAYGAVYASGTYSDSTWFGIMEPGQTIVEPAVEPDWDTIDVFLAKYQP